MRYRWYMERDEKGRIIINKPVTIAIITASVILIATITTIWWTSF